MIRKVKYKAIDPYYSDMEEVFIAGSLDELDSQQYEFEKYLGRNHPAGIRFIYKAEIISETGNEY